MTKIRFCSFEIFSSGNLWDHIWLLGLYWICRRLGSGKVLVWYHQAHLILYWFFFVLSIQTMTILHARRKKHYLRSNLITWFRNECMAWCEFRRAVKLFYSQTILLCKWVKILIYKKFTICYFRNHYICKRLLKLILSQYMQVLKARFWWMIELNCG